MPSETDDQADVPAGEHYRIGAIEAASDRLATHFDGRESSRKSAQAALIQFGDCFDKVAQDGKTAHWDALQTAQRVDFLTRQARQGKDVLAASCVWLRGELADLQGFNWVALCSQMRIESARARSGLDPQTDPGLGILRASDLVRDALDIAKSIVFLLGDSDDASPVDGDELEVTTHNPSPIVSRPRMKAADAEIKARELMARSSTFVLGTSREWARQIGCSPATVTGLVAWIERATVVASRGKKCGKTISLSAGILETHGVGQNNEVLNQVVDREQALLALAAEQDADRAKDEKRQSQRMRNSRVREHN